MAPALADCTGFLRRIGASPRAVRPGPESDLVDWFIEQEPFSVPSGCRATLFREPRIESGFPDLVVVIWSERVASNWVPARAKLTTADIRVMHFLANRGPSTKRELSAVFHRGLAATLDRLLSANMARVARDRWSARPLSKCFAARRIIAVEAKISQWENVLAQAFLNTWFASASYVLVPRLPRSARLLETAQARGVGVWSKDGLSLRTPLTQTFDMPRSYASWLFNEWAWRASLPPSRKWG